jgi:hypothetical protein
LTLTFLQPGGGVLTADDESEISMIAAAGKAVSTPTLDSDLRFLGEPSELRTGRPVDTVLGLDVRMNISSCSKDHAIRLSKELDGIPEEVRMVSLKYSTYIFRSGGL